MRTIEVFADVACPFAHVGLRRLVRERAARGREDVVLRCRAWPLELVNGDPLEPALVAEEVAALRASVAPDLFAHFDPAPFPGSSIPPLALAAVAYGAGPATGEGVSLALRTALFEEGRDVESAAALAAIGRQAGLEAAACDPEALERAADAVRADWHEGVSRGVIGSPHFFVGGTGAFCPTLRISHDEDGFAVELDTDAFEDFVGRCFA